MMSLRMMGLKCRISFKSMFDKSLSYEAFIAFFVFVLYNVTYQQKTKRLRSRHLVFVRKIRKVGICYEWSIRKVDELL